MRKKLFFLCVLVLLLLSCAACGEGTAQTQTSVDSHGTEASTDSEQSTSSTSNRLTSAEVLGASQHLVGLCDQKNTRIVVCDIAVEDWSDDNAVVWEMKHPNFRSVSGLKLRESEYWGGTVVICCHGTGAMIISFDTKEILLDTSLTGENPHSVELLPNGCFVVASSTDNDVRIYAPGEERASQILEHPNAHGALWDPKYEVLWLSGGDTLGAYAFAGTEDAPRLAPISEMVYKTPQAGLHDLAPVYGNPDRLFVTCSAGIMVFDKTTEKFSYSYVGSVVGRNQPYAPGCGSFGQDGVFVFTTIRDDTKVGPFLTDQVGMYVPLGEARGRVVYRKNPDDAYYKIRVWDTDYQ